MNKLNIAELQSIDFDKPSYALVFNTDLVLIRPDGTDEVFVLYGRCQHRGVLMSDARLKGDLITCCLHGSTYNYRTGINIYYPGADLKKFSNWVERGSVWVDADEIETWEQKKPQRYSREAYQGLYADFKGTPDEPHATAISSLAAHG